MSYLLSLSEAVFLLLSNEIYHSRIVVAITILPNTGFGRTQRCTFILAFLHGKEGFIEDLRFPIGPLTGVQFLAQQGLADDDLVEEVPTAVVSQRSDATVEHLPHGVEQAVRLNLLAMLARFEYVFARVIICFEL